MSVCVEINICTCVSASTPTYTHTHIDLKLQLSSYLIIFIDSVLMHIKPNTSETTASYTHDCISENTDENFDVETRTRWQFGRKSCTSCEMAEAKPLESACEAVACLSPPVLRRSSHRTICHHRSAIAAEVARGRSSG